VLDQRLPRVWLEFEPCLTLVCQVDMVMREELENLKLAVEKGKKKKKGKKKGKKKASLFQADWG
jgi:hypothetical protein